MELFGFYASRHYRMLQLNAYSQRQRALAQMLRALAPNVTDVVVVGYGYRCVQASCQWQCQCVCAVWEYVTAMCVRVGCVSGQWSTPAAQGHARQLRAEVLGSLPVLPITSDVPAVVVCVQQTVRAVPSHHPRPSGRLREAPGPAGDVPPLRPHDKPGPAGGHQHPRRRTAVHRDR